MRYDAPVEDWLFLWRHVAPVARLAELPAFADLELSDDLLADLAREAGAYHAEVLLPLSVAGDREGARLEADGVRTPAGFPAAWARYRAAGWPFLGMPTELGGGGMPPLVTAALGEMRGATAHSFMMYGAFCGPAASMLRQLGEPWMRAQLVPRLASGEWTATMGMTEAQAGSGLHHLTTRAEQDADGSWRITGDKVFISGGDHDLTPNIVHIVLAKIPRPDGTIGTSLSDIGVFVVPKILVDPETGALGERNAVTAVGVEHKMGIEGSATCALRFEGAVGYRVMGPGEGTSATMAPMFLLMNAARMGIALTSVGYAEIAWQNALDYAHERLSGRAPEGPRYPDRPADPLVVHPDVRRLLLTTRSFAEGGRALVAVVALQQSLGAEGRALVDFLTPVMKAFFSDRGFRATVDCQQVLGGHGYLKDHPFEQWLRNCRIGQIYEGANGIQARDFVRRRIQTDDRAAFDAFHGAVTEVADGPYGAELMAAADRLRSAAAKVAEADAATALAGSYDLLTAYGVVAVAWAWCLVLRGAGADDVDPAFARGKAQLAEVWMRQELPLVDALCTRATAVAPVIAGPVDGVDLL